MSVPDEDDVLLLEEVALTQFYMTALSLKGERGKADYLVSGTWSKKALKEAKRVGYCFAAWDGSDENFRSVP